MFQGDWVNWTQACAPTIPSQNLICLLRCFKVFQGDWVNSIMTISNACGVHSVTSESHGAGQPRYKRHHTATYQHAISVVKWQPDLETKSITLQLNSMQFQLSRWPADLQTKGITLQLNSTQCLSSMWPADLQTKGITKGNSTACKFRHQGDQLISLTHQRASMVCCQIGNTLGWFDIMKSTPLLYIYTDLDSPGCLKEHIHATAR